MIHFPRRLWWLSMRRGVTPRRKVRGGWSGSTVTLVRSSGTAQSTVMSKRHSRNSWEEQEAYWTELWWTRDLLEILLWPFWTSCDVLLLKKLLWVLLMLPFLKKSQQLVQCLKSNLRASTNHISNETFSSAFHPSCFKPVIMSGVNCFVTSNTQHSGWTC